MKIDIEDGRGQIEAVVADYVLQLRLERFLRDAAAAMRDAERWREIDELMYKHSKPNAGWTLGDLVLLGITPASAVDAAIERRQKGEKS